MADLLAPPGSGQVQRVVAADVRVRPAPPLVVRVEKGRSSWGDCKVHCCSTVREDTNWLMHGYLLGQCI